MLPDADNASRKEFDTQAYGLREQGLTFQAIAERLGVGMSVAWRAVIRHQRIVRQQAEAASQRAATRRLRRQHR